jgi:hypothetical protein
MGQVEPVLQLDERLERLQTQLEGMNVVLNNHLHRQRKRRSGAKTKLAWFRQQAKRLADRAPY